MTEAPGPVWILDQGELLGGAQLHALEVGSNLSERGWPVELVSAPDPDGRFRTRVEASGLPLRTLPMPSLQPFGPGGLLRAGRLALRLAREARRRGVALLHCNTLRTQIVGALAGALSGIPVVWMLHDYTASRGVLRTLGRLPRRLVTVSEPLASYVREEGPRTVRSRVTVVANGVDAARIHAAPPAKAARDRSGREVRFGNGHRYAAVLGRVEPRKGQDVFLRAGIGLRRRCPDLPTTLLVVGEPAPGQDAYLRELQALANSEALDVRFLGHQEDVYGLLKRLDVLVHPSPVPEGFGRTILEAFAAGVPVVATTLGGPAALVEDGRTGLAVPAGDSEALAGAMERVLLDGELADTIRGGGLERTRELTLSATCDGVERVWREAVEGRRGMDGN